MNVKMIITVGALMVAAGVSADTLRVNNVASAGAQFTSIEDAIEAASEGDIIIVEASETSYGDIIVNKKVTLKGPGYFLQENGISNEGVATATCDNVSIGAEGATITGMVIDRELKMRANNLVVTRNYVGAGISLCESYSYTDKFISNGVIHQNFIRTGISGDNYSAPAENIQVSNNIISGDAEAIVGNMTNSVISRNTIIGNGPGCRNLSNCVIEWNIGCQIQNTSGSNSISDNYDIGTYEANKLYGNFYVRKDAVVKETDPTLASDKGAFSGDDPYVLSGVPSGPYIQDIIMPESVVKGEDLKVTVKIGVSK